jgi:DNA-binding NarL/FixJ family response regulator
VTETPPLTVLVARHARSRGPSCLGLLRRQRGIRVVATARGDRDVVEAAAALRPRLLVLDAGPVARTVPPLLRAIRRRCRATRVLVLVQGASQSTALALLCGGASGYLEARRARQVLAKAVRCVGAGQAWIPRRLVPQVVERLRRAAREPA